jgi:hypothetical protein
MVEDLDELILLLLRTDGIRDAVRAYEDETGASRSKAAAAVRRLAQQNGLDHGARAVGQLVAAIVTAITLVAASLFVIIRFS